MYVDFEFIIFTYVLCCVLLLLLLLIEFKKILTYEDQINFINHSLERIPLL
jgi:hypothetical protein